MHNSTGLIRCNKSKQTFEFTPVTRSKNKRIDDVRVWVFLSNIKNQIINFNSIDCVCRQCQTSYQYLNCTEFSSAHTIGVAF